MAPVTTAANGIVAVMAADHGMSNKVSKHKVLIDPAITGLIYRFVTRQVDKTCLLLTTTVGRPLESESIAMLSAPSSLK